MAILPVNEDKVIPIQSVTSESVLLWNVMTYYMGDSEDMEEYLEKILPELTHLCSYVEGYVNSFQYYFQKAFNVYENI